MLSNLLGRKFPPDNDWTRIFLPLEDRMGYRTDRDKVEFFLQCNIPDANYYIEDCLVVRNKCCHLSIWFEDKAEALTFKLSWESK